MPPRFWDELGGADAMHLDRQISRLWVTGDGERDIFARHFVGVVTARLAGA
ncbi:MAG: hypothetical protein HGA51_03805 [Demequinaceae bacterium]|nr:hypothetical protein [Demequinaceae bacterium]